MSFSPKEKLEIVFEGMKSDISITDLCDKYDISRRTYYDWKKEIENGAMDSWNNKKIGRKSQDDVSSIKEAQEKIEELKKQKENLEKELSQTKKEKEKQRLQKDFMKFRLTEDSIDPELKEKNKELLKKSAFQQEQNDGS